MRISLKVGETVYPLAGTSGVSERTHSSAGDFRITAQSEQELIQLLRATTAKMVDRGNLSTTISFSTARLFNTPAEAFLYTLDHDAALPRAGILVMEVTKPNGSQYSRHLMDVVISPPVRRVIGCTALMEYQATGGGIVVGPGFDLPTYTGKMIVAGAYGGYGNGTYLNDGTESGKVFYWVNSHAIFWLPAPNSYWLFSPSGGGARAMRSNSDVATPDLATNWYRSDNSEALPGFSITAETV
jgi:hypothetical protein